MHAINQSSSVVEGKVAASVVYDGSPDYHNLICVSFAHHLYVLGTLWEVSECGGESVVHVVQK